MVQKGIHRGIEGKEGREIFRRRLHVYMTIFSWTLQNRKTICRIGTATVARALTGECLVVFVGLTCGVTLHQSHVGAVMIRLPT